MISHNTRKIVILAIIGFSVALCCSPFYIRHRQYKSAIPPEEVTSILKFQSIMDNGDYTYYSFGRSDRQYFEARRLLPFYFTFRSGWACYVFDDKGRFFDWTPDNGEDPEWDLRWGQLGRNPQSFREVRASVMAFEP